MIERNIFDLLDENIQGLTGYLDFFLNNNSSTDLGCPSHANLTLNQLRNLIL